VIGATFSHRRITEKLGEGGMGGVYKAEDTKLDRPVALKFPAARLLRDDENRKRFEREAKAAAGLHHPNICTVPGRKIAWTAVIPEKRHVELWIVDTENGEDTVAWTGKPDYTAIPPKPNWSPSGEGVGFTLRTLPEIEIWALRNFLPKPAAHQPATDAVQAATFD
jgi:hypothetical protein